MQAQTASSLRSVLGDWRSQSPAHRALADRLRLLVLDGRLPANTRLPAERDLAVALSISRTTVSAAYDHLREAGIVRSRRGAGSWTALPAADATSRAVPSAVASSPLPTPLSTLTSVADGDDVLDLAHGASYAPCGTLQAATSVACAKLVEHLRTHGYDPYGLPALRQAIAHRYTQRGLPTDATQIMITSGSQFAWVLLLRTLASSGERVLIEQPTYPAALDAIQRAGLRPVSVDFAPDGTWDLAALSSEVAQSAPRLAYLIPDFHHPTGACMDIAQRNELVRIARRSRMTLVIDETMAEIALDHPALPPVGGSDPSGADDAVIHTGSLGKTFWGGLRIGWIRANEDIIRRLGIVRATFDMASPLLEQLVSVELLADFDSFVPSRLDWLRQQREHALTTLSRRFPRWRANRPPGGPSLWVELDEPISSALTLAAASRGLLLAAGPRFSANPDAAAAFEYRLRLPYTLESDALEVAFDRLADTYAVVTGNGSAAPAPIA